MAPFRRMAAACVVTCLCLTAGAVGGNEVRGALGETEEPPPPGAPDDKQGQAPPEEGQEAPGHLRYGVAAAGLPA